MCFVLECMTGCFVIFMIVVISQIIIIRCSYFTSKSSSVCFIQMTYVQHDAPTIYSSFAVESEMEDHFLLNHETKQFPKKNAAPMVLFRSSTLPTQSALVNDFKTKS